MNTEKVIMEKKNENASYSRPAAEVIFTEKTDVILTSFLGPEGEEKPEIGPWLPVN